MLPCASMSTPVKYLSASETAVILGLSKRRGNQLARGGKLEGIQIGNSNAIDPEAIQRNIKGTKKKSNGNGHK